MEKNHKRKVPVLEVRSGVHSKNQIDRNGGFYRKASEHGKGGKKRSRRGTSKEAVVLEESPNRQHFEGVCTQSKVATNIRARGAAKAKDLGGINNTQGSIDYK